MPKKLRFFTAYFVHYFKKYILAIVFGIIFGSVVYVERSQLFRLYQTLSPPRTDIGIEGIYTIKTLPVSVLNQISPGLTSISENNKSILSPIVKNLAISDNNLTYTFTLNDNLTWQNGKKLNVSDIEINIPQTKTSAVNNNTLKITTSESFSPLLSTLSKPIFIKDSLVGLGEYKVTSTAYQDGHIKLLRLTSTINNQKINYHFYPNSTDLLNAFKLGEVNEIYSNTLDNQLDAWPKIKISPSISASSYLAVFLNTEKISNKQDRQALAYATPKTEDKNIRSLGPISPNSWAYNPQIKPYNYNPTRAKELFEKEGLTQIKLTIADRKLLTLGEAIKKSWEETLGIKVTISISTGPINPSDYEALIAYSAISPDPDQYSLWHSTQTLTNITSFNNSRIDKLLEEGRQVQDQQERKKIYYDFQKFLLEESPAIFLEFPTTYIISRVK